MQKLMVFQLKKLINQVVNELVSLGLRPSLLQHLLDQRGNGEALDLDGLVIPGLGNPDAELIPEVTYELLPGANSIEPRLRLRLKKPTSRTEGSSQTNVLSPTRGLDKGLVDDTPATILSPKYIVSFISEHKIDLFHFLLQAFCWEYS